MTKSGMSTNEILGGSKRGGLVNLVTCFEASRRPTVHDTKYPLLTLWRVSERTEGIQEGEVWQLISFGSRGVANWHRVNYSNSSPGLEQINTDCGRAFADELNSVAITGGVHRSESDPCPISTIVKTDGSITVSAQIAQSVDSEPDSALNSGVSCYDSSQFDVSENGVVRIKGADRPSFNTISVNSGSQNTNKMVKPDKKGGLNFGVDTHKHSGNPLDIKVKSESRITLSAQVASTVQDSDGSANGVCHFSSSQFNVDGNGLVKLANGNRIIKKIQSGNTSVEPGEDGVLRLKTLAVQSRDKPFSATKREGSLCLEIQTASAVASIRDKSKLGLACFDRDYFTVSDGYVSVKKTLSSFDRVKNLSFIYQYPTIIAVAEDETKLSEQNPGFYKWDRAIFRVQESYKFNLHKNESQLSTLVSVKYNLSNIQLAYLPFAVSVFDIPYGNPFKFIVGPIDFHNDDSTIGWATLCYLNAGREYEIYKDFTMGSFPIGMPYKVYLIQPWIVYSGECPNLSSRNVQFTQNSSDSVTWKYNAFVEDGGRGLSSILFRSPFTSKNQNISLIVESENRYRSYRGEPDQCKYSSSEMPKDTYQFVDSDGAILMACQLGFGDKIRMEGRYSL